MINLNNKKQLITKKEILKHIDDYSIFRYYCGEFDIKKPFLSPLLKDNKPSFGIFIGENNELFFKDFRLGGGDFVKFVQLKFDLTYYEALSKIVEDFNLSDLFFCKKSFNSKPKLYNKKLALSKVSKFSPKIKSREWKLKDFKFWKQYGISYNTLIKYNVKPIKYIFIKDHIIKADELAYAFLEHKDNKTSYKIYQPYNKDYKWINSHDESVWQGWTQMPTKGEVLIITKSLKDVMCIIQNTNFNAVSLQTENIIPKNHIIEELKSRFKNIFIIYDNDFDSDINWGVKFAQNLSNQFNIPYGIIQLKYKSKDLSDLYKNHGIESLKEEINRIYKLISLPF